MKHLYIVAAAILYVSASYADPATDEQWQEFVRPLPALYSSPDYKFGGDIYIQGIGKVNCPIPVYINYFGQAWCGQIPLTDIMF